ncbi:MAG: hypothetical protein ABIF18_00110 [archaeon]
MLKLFNKREKLTTALRAKKMFVNYPVFNLEITRDKTMPLMKEYDRTSQYIGEFMACSSGQLIRGKENSLHTYEIKLGYCEDHIHFPKRGIVDIITKNQKPFLEAEFENSRFTLNGLYSSVWSWELKKPEMLIDHIKKFNPEFQFNSIATREDTRVKLLEHAYKKYVSNQ